MFEAVPLSIAATLPLRASRAEHVLTGLPYPLIVLQSDRQLIYANPSAENLFADAMARRMSNRLMDLGQLDANKLEQLLRLTAGGSPALAGLWFAPGLQTGRVSLSLLSPYIARAADWPAGCLLLMMVHLDEPALTQGARIDAVCRQCRLTHTERYVLMLLADGLAVNAAARQLGLQISTLRSHIRHLLDKTEAASLVQLLRWLGSAAPRVN